MVAQGGPVRLLDEVSKALPSEVWLTAFTRTGKKLDVSGIAYSNFNVATFMTNLGKAGPLISNVDLVVSEKTLVEQVPVERFSITMEVKDGKGSPEGSMALDVKSYFANDSQDAALPPDRSRRGRCADGILLPDESLMGREG